MLSRRSFLIHQTRFLWSSFSAGTVEGHGETEFENEGERKRKLSGNLREEDSRRKGLVKVREFFDKYKPPPAPPPRAPKKEWLLRRLPEPEEVFDQQQNEPVPPIGDVEAEKQWLNFGEESRRYLKPLVTQTPEFHKISKEVDREMETGTKKRAPFNASQRHIPHYQSDLPTRGLPWNDSLELNHSFAQQHSTSKIVSQRKDLYDDLSQKLDATENEGLDQNRKQLQNGFENTTQPMDQQGMQHVKTIKTTVISKELRHESSKDKNAEMTSAAPAEELQDLFSSEEHQITKTESDDVYDRLIAEDLSEHVIYSTESDSTKVYDYNPSNPRWLNPPDGHFVGAIPQREYNDFVPFKEDVDIWTESSALRFEDSGQDPTKHDRHKLYGEEYWVAKPMLMEKYDYEDAATSNQMQNIEDKRFRDLDKEIPRHFVQDDGSIVGLSIPETQAYPDFFRTDSLATTFDSENDDGKLYTMHEKWNKNFVKITLKNKQLNSSNSSINGYSVQNRNMFKFSKESFLFVMDVGDDEEADEEKKEWLNEIPTPRDVGYDKGFLMMSGNANVQHFQSIFIVYTNYHQIATIGNMQEEGYGRLEKFIESSALAQPSVERVEEIKALEGVSSETATGNIHENMEELGTNDREEYYDMARDEDLVRLAEAERRNRDIFTDEKSDATPRIFSSAEKERLDALKKLNKEGACEQRPTNELLVAPSQNDYDPWILRELSKYKKENGTFEDLFSLACHPKMLESAYASLRNRRPGSVPKQLENNVFELASRILLMGEVKKETAMSPKKPNKHIGKSAHSRRIFSQPEKIAENEN